MILSGLQLAQVLVVWGDGPESLPSISNPGVFCTVILSSPSGKQATCVWIIPAGPRYDAMDFRSSDDAKGRKAREIAPESPKPGDE